MCQLSVLYEHAACAIALEPGPAHAATAKCVFPYIAAKKHFGPPLSYIY